MSPSFPASVTVREVGPRDGLQVEGAVPVGARVALIDALVGAGVTEVEAVAFVSPRAVPSMAAADEVVARLPHPDGVRYWALVPNVRGATMALDAGVDGLSVTVSASEKYSEKNVRMSVAESADEAGRIAALAQGRVPVDAVISCAFGSPYEGDLEPRMVAGLGEQLLDGGATSLTYADTTGMATPRRVAELLEVTGLDVGLHFHETRGTGLVNVYAALEAGVSSFDSSIGGLGGSPFAAGSAGNVATEELVHLCDDLGIDTGIDLERLLDASKLLVSIVGHPVASRVAVAGPRWRRSEG
jgi:hydroxymethylglutaryl-CoA lyase